MGQFLRHVFLPHHTNNHRPKALHEDALFAYVLLFAVLNLGIRVMYRQFPQVLGYATDIHVEQLLSLTNTKREASGLPTLTINSQLSQAAAKKAQDMFSNGYWAHMSPNGRSPWDFIVESGYRYSVAGENLAKNFSNSQGVVDAWMASPTHRDNILKSNYRDIGFAVVNGVLNGEETTLVVQMFGSTGQVALLPKPGPIVKEAQASVPLPTPIPVIEKAQQPVIVSQEGSAMVQSEATTGLAALLSGRFMNVVKNPLFNIPSVTRDIGFAFIGILMGILAIDSWIITRKHIVRASGHSIAHLLFLGALLVAFTAIQRGTLL